MEFTAKQIADIVKGEIIGNDQVSINGVAPLDEASEGKLSFLYDEKHIQFLTQKGGASLILLSKNLYKGESVPTTLILVPNARSAMGELLRGVYDFLNPRRKGVESPSFITEGSHIPATAYVGSLAYIGKNVTIGENVQIYPHCFIGDNVKIGNNTILYAGVKVCFNCIIGSDCILQPGVVVGGDGFGFEPDDQHVNRKLPQIGNVKIGNDVEIGANTTIDRAMLSSTTIGDHTKIGDMVIIGHNVRIGSNCILCGQTGIAGSVTIGDRCILAGQVGVADHVSIPNDTIFGAQSGINTSVRKSGIYMGSPAINADTWRRSAVGFKQLPDIIKKLNELI